MGDIGLAATKLRPPLPPARPVRRDRLERALDSGVAAGARLLLLSAPAGSGKSTLLSCWLAVRNEPMAWLQVESSDSDPARFWTGLAQAVRQAVPGCRDLAPLVASAGGDELSVVSALVNELVGVDRLVVVLDDYHLIDDGRVHAGVERFIELAPPQVTVVLSTRIDPPFRLGRLRVRRQLHEVRGADLRFDPEEATGLLAASGPALDAAAVDELCGRTEGWAAGLVLAGLSLQRVADPTAFLEAFRGDDQLVVEYLRDEFLAALEAEDRLRMLQTSVLEQFDGPLVDAVTGDRGGATWLRATAATNQLLIGLDLTGTWFRYHHLLRDLLHLEARQALGDGLLDLHRRAAQEFASRGDHGQAIRHSLAAGDVEEAARLLIVHGPKLLKDGQVDTLRGILEAVGELGRTHLGCALLHGWCDYLGGRYSRAEGWLDTAVALAPPGFDVVVTTSLRINIALARGDVATALSLARSVDVPSALSSRNADLGTAVGAAYAWAGLADDARRVLQFAAEKAEAEHFPTARLLALVSAAVVELDSGTPATAASAAEAALVAAAGYGLADYHGVAPAYAVRASTSDDPARALVDAARALGLGRRASTDLGRAYVLTSCGDTLLGSGDPSGLALLDEARTLLGRCVDPGIVGRHLARAEARHGVHRPPAPPAPGLVEQLTERELALLQYLPTQLSQRDIAAAMYVSVNTVKTHCQATYRKLGVGDRRAAVQAARDLHLL